MTGTCTDVKIIDALGRFVAGAAVSLMRDHGGGFASGTTFSTDARGIACVEDLDVGARLEVTAPEGPYAGTTTVKLTQQHVAQTPVTVQLLVQPLKGTTLRGRVLAPDGSPVVGAGVTITELFPTNPNDCTPPFHAAPMGSRTYRRGRTETSS